MQKNKIDSLDLFKAIACIFVVLIHCRFPGYLGNFFRTIAKFAVPYFFIISGFFSMYGNPLKYNKSKMKSKIWHIVKLIISVSIFYSIFYIFNIILLKKETLALDNILTYDNIIKFIIANSPIVYSHLWFIFALLYCYIFSFLLGKKMEGKWKKNYIILASLIFVITSEILPKYGIKIMVGSTKIPIYNMFIFRSLPFYLIGMVLREDEKKIIEYNIANKKILFLILLGTACSLIERLIFVESQFYIGTYFTVIGIFIYALRNREVNQESKIKFIGKSLSNYVYIYHIAILEVLNYIYTKFELDGIYDYMKPIFLIILSLMTSYIVYFIKSNLCKIKVQKKV